MMVSASHLPRHPPHLAAYTMSAALHASPACIEAQTRAITPITKLLVSSCTQQRRTFFWWNKRSHDWSSYLDANFQQRIKRRQRKVLYKYSKSLYRNQSWDRDPSHNACRQTWGWRLSSSWGRGRWVDVDRLSSLRPKERGPEQSSESWNDRYAVQRKKATRVYEAFKAKIDADPYGALFGRSAARLYGYTSLGRQWSPLSWCVGSTKIQHEAAPRASESIVSDATAQRSGHAQGQIIGSDAAKVAAKYTSQPRQGCTDYTVSNNEEEFVYDPISMRKVPKAQTTSQKPIAPATTVSEKAIDIPVKIFTRCHDESVGPRAGTEDKTQLITHGDSKPSKIPTFQEDNINTHGPSGASAQTDEAGISCSPKYDAAHASHQNPDRTCTAGASKYSASTAGSATPKGQRAESADDALFAGTTYSSREDLRPCVSGAPSYEWLNREGFGSKPANKNVHVEGRTDVHPAPTVHQDAKLDKSPALTRSEAAPTADLSRSDLNDSFAASRSEAEDMDLLRASDVRAAVKLAGTTRTEVENAKKDRRQRLKADFMSRGKGPEALQAEVNIKRLREAQMRKSVAMGGERQPAPNRSSLPVAQGTSTSRSTTGNKEEQKPVLSTLEQSESTEGKSIPQTSDTSNTAHSPIHLALSRSSQESSINSKQSETIEQAMEKGSSAMHRRTAELQRRTKIAEQKQEEAKIQLQRLALELRDIYEDTYGILDVKHRQSKANLDPVGEGPMANAPRATSASNTAKDEGVKSWYETRRERARAYDTMPIAETGIDAYDMNTIFRNIRITQSLIKDAEQALSKVRLARTDLNAQRDREADRSLVDAVRVLEQKGYIDRPLAQDISNRIATVDDHSQNAGASSQTTSTGPQTAGPTASSPSPPASAAALYKVLAYDSSTLKITAADTTSSATPGAHPTLTPTEVLSRLNAPAKFLPYFTQMHAQGYEIVSGGGDMLVFEKVREALTVPAAQVGADATRSSSDAMVSSSDVPRPRIVKREEDRFSGSNRKWQDELQEHFEKGQWDDKKGHGFIKATQRVLLTGMAFAAICYAIGAVAESFRSAEQDEGSDEHGKVERRGGRPGIFRTEDSR